MLDTETKQKIFLLLNKIYPKLTHPDLRYQMIVDDDRAIYRITSPSMRNYIFKTVGKNRKSESEFTDEFEKMRLINENAKLKSCCINLPHPIGLVSDTGILMTECRGKTLKSLYFNSLYNPIARRTLLQAVEKSASLLADIHSITLQHEKYTEHLNNRQKNLNRMLESICKKRMGKNPLKTLTAAVDFFSDINAKASVIKVSILHGNFALRNLLWDGKTLNAIDLEDSRRDTIYFDLGMLIAELLNKKVYPASSNYNLTLIKTFKKHYCERISFDPLILTSYIIYHLIWSYYELDLRKPSQNKLKTLWLDYRRRHLLWEIDRLLESAETR